MHDDFVSSSAIYLSQFDLAYSRFSLHSVDKEQELSVIDNVSKALKKGGLFCIETRSVHDELYGLGEPCGDNAWKYNGHYRRFIVINELIQELEQSGFDIVYAREERGFAPFEDTDPPIIRIIAAKQ